MVSVRSGFHGARAAQAASAKVGREADSVKSGKKNQAGKDNVFERRPSRKRRAGPSATGPGQ